MDLYIERRHNTGSMFKHLAGVIEYPYQMFLSVPSMRKLVKRNIHLLVARGGGDILFGNIAFQGRFRPHQQRILDALAAHNNDQKIHIVAAPGSGKTVMGLEMICRLGAPALVLSPTVTVQHQWGQRFADCFLPAGADTGNYLSYDLHAPALVTSLTYQGLYAVWNRLVEGEAESGEAAAIDYNGLELVDILRKAGVRTLCLDEAHHLKSAWQRALEAFVSAVQEDMTIISLTATPPYDATAAEWGRYCALCGEIDEEIAVPALVQQGILCPHQDFLYFNRPTSNEETAMLEYRRRAYLCVAELLESPLLGEILEKAHVLDASAKWMDWRMFHVKGVQALLVLAAHKGVPIPHSTAREMFLKGRVPAFSMNAAATAFHFVMDNPDIFSKELAQELSAKLVGAGVQVRGQLNLDTDPRLNRRLAGSSAKLESIAAIAAAEWQNLGGALRMVILTDYIGKELLPVIGTDAPLSGLDSVSIFELLRRHLPPSVPVALLTGSLVLLPVAVLAALSSECQMYGAAFTSRPVLGAPYCEVDFSAGNRQKVAILTALFAAGQVQVLIGTKSLLGEGWDSPCINSLVLASYVGSFVLSNQMRGRAIRRDPANLGKVSNIWHLATLLPPAPAEDGLHEPIPSDDFETLKRRFDCFMAPSYHGDSIESGIGRVYIVQPPYETMDIEAVNRQMLERASDRLGTANAWAAVLPKGTTPQILGVADVPYTAAPPHFFFSNVMRASGLAVALSAIVGFLWAIPQFMWSWKAYLIAGAACLIASGLVFWGFYLTLRILSPEKYIRRLAQSLFDTLWELGEICSPGARLEMQADPHGLWIDCALADGSLREKQLFCSALAELFSPYDSPRYLIIRERRFLFWKIPDYAKSYACPAVIANHRKRIDVFRKYLVKGVGRFRLVYTPNNRDSLLKGLKRGYINRNGAFIESKRLVRRGHTAGMLAAGAKAKMRDRIKRFFRGLVPGLDRDGTT